MDFFFHGYYLQSLVAAVAVATATATANAVVVPQKMIFYEKKMISVTFIVLHRATYICRNVCQRNNFMGKKLRALEGFEGQSTYTIVER